MGGAEAIHLLEETRSMAHRNAPLTVLGSQRAVTEVLERGRPIAHVAAEFHIARATLSKWVARYRDRGSAGLVDHSSAPRRAAVTVACVGGGVDRARVTDQ